MWELLLGFGNCGFLRAMPLTYLLLRSERCYPEVGRRFVNRNFDRVADAAQTYTSLENMRNNMVMKQFAKEVLLEENYIKFIKSYKFTFWFQLIGILAGFIIPCVVFLVIFKQFEYCLFGASFGIFWTCIWLPVSMFIPQTKIYRKFAKWFRKNNATLDELDAIFYES